MLPQLLSSGMAGGVSVPRVDPPGTTGPSVDRPPLADVSAPQTSKGAEPPPVNPVEGTTDVIPSLLPPNPNAPAGPPPAFEASILDQTMESLRAPANLVREGEAVAEAEMPPAPYDVPPSRADRAAENVTTLRRFETPYDTTTVDVSR